MSLFKLTAQKPPWYAKHLLTLVPMEFCFDIESGKGDRTAIVYYKRLFGVTYIFEIRTF